MALAQIDHNVAYLIRPWGSLHTVYAKQFDVTLSSSGLPLSPPLNTRKKTVTGSIYLAHFGDNPFLMGQFDKDISLIGHLYQTTNPEKVAFFENELLGHPSLQDKPSTRRHSWITTLGTIPLDKVQPLYAELKEMGSGSDYHAKVLDLTSRTKDFAQFKTSY